MPHPNPVARHLRQARALLAQTDRALSAVPMTVTHDEIQALTRVADQALADALAELADQSRIPAQPVAGRSVLAGCGCYADDPDCPHLPDEPDAVVCGCGQPADQHPADPRPDLPADADEYGETPADWHPDDPRHLLLDVDTDEPGPLYWELAEQAEQDGR